MMTDGEPTKIGRPKAADPVIQRNYYLPKSKLQAFEAAAAKAGRKMPDIVAELVDKWVRRNA